MPQKIVDKHSGAILFRRTPEEKKIIEISKENQELKKKQAELEEKMDKLLKSLGGE